MDALNSGALSSEALLDALLARVDAQNPKINAIVAQDREAARERARAADAARAAGENWGPLHGLPMTIKDTFEVPGMITAAGSPALAGHRGDRWLDAAMFGPARRPVRDVMVGGRWRVREGRHPQAEATFARYRATLRRLVA